MKKIAIIGGGISGLYFANILNNHKDFDYKIFEKKDNYNFLGGYGIQLSVNSIKLLNSIGFKNLPASEVSFPSKVNFIQANNSKKICDIDLTQFNDPLNRYTTLKRSTLLEFLFKNVPENRIKFKSNIKKIENTNSFRITLDENKHEEFDYLIIADGIFSKTKSLIFNEVKNPKYNLNVALRGKLTGHFGSDISIYMGSNSHYVTYPVNQNNEHNFVAIMKKKLPSDQLKNYDLFKSAEFLNSLVSGLQKTSQISFENLSELKSFPVYISSDFPSLNKKNIFLSGDALFTFPPSFAQGASQSIETANDILKSILSGTNEFYQERIRSISSINNKSKLNHFSFHLSNPINIFIRNKILKYLSKNETFLENYLGKIYRA
ncbi:FAD-dependent monooxygenase [Candidatus Pelagibacter sp.]|nr:FAD-dependent monooxygenase [Candidatus Pelagibacter sp.]